MTSLVNNGQKNGKTMQVFQRAKISRTNKTMDLRTWAGFMNNT